MITAYRHPHLTTGNKFMTALIDSVATGVPKSLGGIITLCRTLEKRSAAVLAFFDHADLSNGTTEAINGRLEQRLPKPDELHRSQPHRVRRHQTPTTPWIVRSR